MLFLRSILAERQQRHVENGTGAHIIPPTVAPCPGSSCRKVERSSVPASVITRRSGRTHGEEEFDALILEVLVDRFPSKTRLDSDVTVGFSELDDLVHSRHVDGDASVGLARRDQRSATGRPRRTISERVGRTAVMWPSSEVPPDQGVTGIFNLVWRRQGREEDKSR